MKPPGFARCVIRVEYHIGNKGDPRKSPRGQAASEEVSGRVKVLTKSIALI